MIEEDKVTLARTRAELVEKLAAPLSAEDRVRVQGELSIVNAKIKALNTTEAARLKAAADRRKVAGLAEAQANTARAAARARTKVNGSTSSDDPDGDEDEGQTTAIDGWIDAVLLRHDVDFTRSPDGALTIDVAPKWAAVFGALIDGIYAAARGDELPELPALPAPAPPPKAPKTTKSKKR